MKKFIMVTVIAITVVTATLFTGTSTSAQTVTESARCSVAQARIATQLARVEATKTTQIKAYNDVKARIDTLLSNAVAASYTNIAALTAARDAVQAKIVTYTEKATAYSTALGAAQSLTCGKAEGDFAKAIISSRAALLEVRTASLDVRTTLRNEAIPALRDYAAWLKERSTTTEETN